jgi:hypothetical protein
MRYVLERRDGRRIQIDSDRLTRASLTAELFEEAWRRASPETFHPSILRISVDLGRPIGRAAIVRAPVIKPTETAAFARRRDTLHHRPSRVVQIEGRLPQTSRVTIIAHGIGEDEWRLRTAYCGQYVYPQPWDFRAIAENGLSLDRVLDFWCRAAFLYRPMEFESKVHQDTWAGLLEQAAQLDWSGAAATIGYPSVRQQWAAQD